MVYGHTFIVTIFDGTHVINPMKKLFSLIVLLITFTVLFSTSAHSQSIKSEVVRQFEADTDIIFPLTVAFTPDSKWLVFGRGKDKLRLFDLTKKDVDPVDVVTDARSYISACAFTQDGNTLVLGFKSGEIRFFDMATRTFTKTITAHEKAVCDLVFSDDGQTFYSGSKDNTIKSWTITGETLKTYEAPGGAWSIKFNNNVLFYNNQKGSNCLAAIDLESGVAVTLPADVCNHIDVNKAGTAAVAQYTNSVQLVNTLNNAKVELKGHSGWINDVSFNKQGNLLASTSGDKMVFLWDLDKDSTVIHKIDIGEKGLTSTFSPDGKWLATQTSFRLMLTKLKTGENVARTEKQYYNGKYIGGLKNGLRHSGDSSVFLFKDGSKFIGTFKYDRMNVGDLYKPDGTKVFHEMKFRESPCDVAFELTYDNTNSMGGRTVENYLYFVRIDRAPSDITDTELIAIGRRVRDLMLEKNKQTATEEFVDVNRGGNFADFRQSIMRSRGNENGNLIDQVMFEDYFYESGLGFSK
jgi:WD40 repeat protein